MPVAQFIGKYKVATQLTVNNTARPCPAVAQKALSRDTVWNKTLINQFNRIIELSEENQTAVSKLIDAFLFQQEMKQKLAQ